MALTDLAPSGLELEQWTPDLKEMYTKTTILFTAGLAKSPSSSSIASSSGASSYYSMESGISSMSTESGISYQQSFSSNYENLLLSALDIPKELKIEPFESVKCYKAEKVIYQGRNILDLASNLNGGWKYQAAILPDGMSSYFENRSQYSRLQGAHPPNHMNATCNDKDCAFVEPIYI